MDTIGTAWMGAGFFAFVLADVAKIPVFLALGVVVLLIAVVVNAMQAEHAREFAQSAGEDPLRAEPRALRAALAPREAAR